MYIKNKLFSKTFALLLCIVFAFSCTTSHSINASSTDLEQDWRSKIDEELWAVMQTKADDDLISVYLWLDDGATWEKFEKIMCEEKNMDPAVYEDRDRFNAEIVPSLAMSFQNDEIKDITKSGIDINKSLEDKIYNVNNKYRETKLKVLKQVFTQSNEEFLDLYVDTINRKVEYKGKVTATLVVDATKKEIVEYAKLKEVNDISFNAPAELVEAEDPALYQIHADTVTGTKSSRYNDGTGYKGQNVKIGIIEPGVYDATHPQLLNLPEERLRILDNAGDNGAPLNKGVSLHATKVTSLIVGQPITIGGKTYEGIVPMASVILTPISSSKTLYNAILSLTEEGCSVINISAGYRVESDAAKYSYIDREVDRILASNDVVVVNAAGNIRNYPDSNELDPNTINLISPSKALNVICVGNAYTKNSATSTLPSPYKMLSGSSYIEADYVPNKPDISAPGCNISYVTSSLTISPSHGTSLSAPNVTGVVAQMFEANPDITPQEAKNILLASADYSKINPDRDDTEHYYCVDDVNIGSYLREVSGAGLVNAARAVNAAKNLGSGTQLFNLTESNSVVEMTLGQLNQGERVRILMTFYKTRDSLITSVNDFDNVDLSLLKTSSYSVISSSASPVNNIEIIEYTVPSGETGNYHYKLNASRIVSASIPVCVTWIKWRPGDANLNGVTNNLDAGFILQYDSGVVELTPEQFFIADVNKDGKVNNIDSTLVLQYDSGLDITLQ